MWTRIWSLDKNRSVFDKVTFYMIFNKSTIWGRHALSVQGDLSVSVSAAHLGKLPAEELRGENGSGAEIKGMPRYTGK